MPAERIVHSADEALVFAGHIGYPVVLKTAVESIAHKSEAGGIHLNLTDDESVITAYQDLSDRLGDAVLVQAMVNTPDCVELILGMQRDPQFGPMLVFGLGGIFVEVFKDAVTVMPPLSVAQAGALPRRLKGAPLLHGARGKTPVDLQALTDAIISFARFVSECGHLLNEVDINPLIVSAKGCAVVDALIVPATET